MENQDVSSDLKPPPSKRQKFYRKREILEDERIDDIPIADHNTTSVTPEALTIEELISHHASQPNIPLQNEESTQLSTAEILRHRKAAQRRRFGIEFTNVDKPKINTTTLESSNALTEKDDTASEIKTVIDRFAPQTGQVADVNKHMMAYIDSELAKRFQGNADPSTDPSERIFSPTGALIDAGLNRQPAALGRLQEIDLGPDSTLRNITRTEAAKRKLQGEEVDVEEEKTTGKVRLRRDGKPWRGRKRRNSDDIKRDQLVEEVMRETRLEIYDEPDPDAADNDDDQAADDRIAEQFRRDFLDAISSRRQRASRAAKAAKAAKAGIKVDDRPRGPKLGGSRSARAAMREMQEKKGKK